MREWKAKKWRTWIQQTVPRTLCSTKTSYLLESSQIFYAYSNPNMLKYLTFTEIRGPSSFSSTLRSLTPPNRTLTVSGKFGKFSFQGENICSCSFYYWSIKENHSNHIWVCFRTSLQSIRLPENSIQPILKVKKLAISFISSQ